MKKLSLIISILLLVCSTSMAQAPKATAKTLILVFLDGGPSQTDTFDPKPEAGRDFYGKYARPIPLSTDSTIFIGEKLPRLASIADKYTIIRSMTHNNNAHEKGCYFMLSGETSQTGISYPSFCSAVAYFARNEYKGDIPSYVSVIGAGSRFNESGFLPAQFKSFDTGGAPERPNMSVEGIVNNSITTNRQQKRRKLLSTIDKLSENVTSNEQTRKLTEYRTKAYNLILGDTKKVFDLSEESEQTRKRYGMTRFGQSCLLARRLVQAGVKVINVRYTGWDTHKEHFKRMDERLADLDRGLSALLCELDSLNLLDSTVLLCGGEFGRTPRVSWEPPWNGGRGHYGPTFSYLVAGGGFEGGRVIGATDARGEKVVERPVHPCDLIGSVYTLLGIDPYCTVDTPFGKLPLLPSLGKEGLSNGLLKEIMPHHFTKQ